MYWVLHNASGPWRFRLRLRINDIRIIEFIHRETKIRHLCLASEFLLLRITSPAGLKTKYYDCRLKTASKIRISESESADEITPLTASSFGVVFANAKFNFVNKIFQSNSYKKSTDLSWYAGEKLEHGN